MYHYIINSLSSTHLRASPKNVVGHIEIPNYLHDSEKNILITKFEKEFDFFKLWSICLAVNMVSQWYKCNKKEKKHIKNFFSTLLNRDIIDNIIKNKFIAKQIKLEFFVLKLFGINFHLFVFPFYKGLRRVLRFFSKEKF